MLAIGGVDPGGGAGLAADVRAVAAGGAVACPVVATITVQSTSGLVTQHAVASALVMQQAACVLEHQRVRAIKTGALGDARNVAVVARIATQHRDLPLVIDPVRMPSRGRAALLDRAGASRIARELVPLATLVTPNADEATMLTSVRVKDVASATRAARALVAMGARAALVKGGHLRGREAIDVLVIGERVALLATPRLALDRGVHGGGCALASLVAARLARAAGRGPVTDAVIEASVQWSKARHFAALSGAEDVGGKALVLCSW